MSIGFALQNRVKANISSILTEIFLKCTWHILIRQYLLYAALKLSFVWGKKCLFQSNSLMRVPFRGQVDTYLRPSHAYNIANILIFCLPCVMFMIMFKSLCNGLSFIYNILFPNNTNHKRSNSDLRVSETNLNKLVDKKAIHFLWKNK